VRRLALLAPAGTLAPIPWGFIWRAVLCAIPLKFFMNNFMNWVRVTDDVDEETKKGLDDIAEDGWISNRSFRPRRMVPPIPPTDDQWRKLSVPTLILAGDREVIFPAEKSLARVAALSPLIETALLNGMGHDFFQARAKDVNRLVLDFLEAK
jgi:pimeloyl-ACP methyl ester carboxylesterase